MVSDETEGTHVSFSIWRFANLVYVTKSNPCLFLV